MKLKKLLCSVLALAMVLSTMGTVAFATENVVEIAAGTYSATDFETYIHDGVTLKAAEDATVVFEMGGSKPYFDGANMTFEGITFNWDTSDYKGLQHCGDLTYNNCTINGTVFLYGGKQVFTNCDFAVSGDKYNVWTYTADEVEFNNCSFTSSGKSVLIYNEGDSEDENGDVAVDVKECTFVVDGETVDATKAAIEMHTYGGDITLTIDDKTTATGFGTETVSGNSLWNDKTSTKDGAKNDTLVKVNNEIVWAADGEGETVSSAVVLVNDKPYATFDAAVTAINQSAEENITVELLADATLDVNAWQTLAIGADTTETITIDGNENKLTFNQLDSDWNHVTTNGAKLILNNMSITNSGHNDGPWNRHDINFACDVELNNVTSDKALAFKAGAKLNTVTISDANTSDTYAIWIQPNGQTVSLNKVTIDMIDCTDGRGVKIDNQYNEDVEKAVTLNVTDCTFKTEEKGAILVKSNVGATIIASGENDISEVAADSTNLVWIDEDAKEHQENVTVEGASKIVEGAVAKIGDTYYTSLEDALAAADENAEIVLLADQFVIDSIDEDVVYDLNGCTIKGAFAVTEASTVEFKNGTIINENSGVSAIETVGTTTLTNINVTSARHAVRVENGKVVVNGGTYAVKPNEGTDMTQNVVNVGESGKVASVIINGGTFIGPKGTTANSGAAVTVKDGSTVIINDGDFSGGKNNTLSSKGTLIVLGGTFDQDPSAYVGNGYNVTNTEGVYTVEENAASEVKVVFEQVTESTYNIVLESVDGKNINEFVAAELTFNNESTTAAGIDMTYEISGYTDENGTVQTVVLQADENADTYGLRIKDENARITGNKITIGQVTFNGQGTINFNVESGRVVATKSGYNVEKYYIADEVAETKDTLILDDAVIGVDTIKERDVIVNIDYKHILDGTGWTDNQITVTLKDSFGESVAPVSSNDRQFKFENVKEGRIVVTLEAPGFRKYVYTTMLKDVADENDALVLNFWNDVKKNEEVNGVVVDPLAEIEAGVSDKINKNFVVGDIVMDMIVDEYDLAAVTSYYGMYELTDADKYIKYDLNRDGNIDIIDVAYVLHTFGN